jgi:hypothetical protein
MLKPEVQVQVTRQVQMDLPQVVMPKARAELVAEQ